MNVETKAGSTQLDSLSEGERYLQEQCQITTKGSRPDGHHRFWLSAAMAKGQLIPTESSGMLLIPPHSKLV